MSAVNLADKFNDVLGDVPSQEASVKGWLSTGFAPLNKILSGEYGGGIGYGRLYEIFGPSSSGKTVIATNLMIEAQRAGGVAIFVDYEQAFMKELAGKLGLDTKALIHIEPLTWEEGMKKGINVAERIREKDMIDKDAPILMIADSIAAAVPKSVMEKEVDEHTMNDTTALARATSATLRVVVPRAKRADLTCVFLNQIRTKPGVVYGDPTTTPGGNSMEFYASGRISLGRKKNMIKDPNDSKKKILESQTITFKAVKSKHTRPFGETEMYFKFNADGSGEFEVVRSLVKHLSDIGKIAKSGNYLVWTDGKKYYEKQLAERILKDGLEEELNNLLE